MARPSDEDVEDYVHLGTPLEEEVESRAGQYAKAVADPGSTKSLPVWKQVCPCAMRASLMSYSDHDRTRSLRPEIWPGSHG